MLLQAKARKAKAKAFDEAHGIITEYDGEDGAGNGSERLTTSELKAIISKYLVVLIFFVIPCFLLWHMFHWQWQLNFWTAKSMMKTPRFIGKSTKSTSSPVFVSLTFALCVKCFHADATESLFPLCLPRWHSLAR